jgi:hypothetical protein
MDGGRVQLVNQVQRSAPVVILSSRVLSWRHVPFRFKTPGKSNSEWTARHGTSDNNKSRNKEIESENDLRLIKLAIGLMADFKSSLAGRRVWRLNGKGGGSRGRVYSYQQEEKRPKRRRRGDEGTTVSASAAVRWLKILLSSSCPLAEPGIYELRNCFQQWKLPSIQPQHPQLWRQVHYLLMKATLGHQLGNSAPSYLFGQ